MGSLRRQTRAAVCPEWIGKTSGFRGAAAEAVFLKRGQNFLLAAAGQFTEGEHYGTGK
jgi:hypothetical protein